MEHLVACVLVNIAQKNVHFKEMIHTQELLILFGIHVDPDFVQNRFCSAGLKFLF